MFSSASLAFDTATHLLTKIYFNSSSFQVSRVQQTRISGTLYFREQFYMLVLVKRYPEIYFIKIIDQC